MTTQIQNLKTELREFIELSKEETKWKVSHRKGGVFICAADKVGLPTDVCRLYQCSRTEPRAIFIARSRNISPAMAECLLSQIEWLERYAVPVESANQQLQQILTIWEASK